MRTLDYSYSMELRFTQPASKHQFTLRMLPASDERQEILKCQWKVQPECRLYRGEDAFGNKYVHGEIEESHPCFGVEVFGTALVKESYEIPMNEKIDLARYRYPSRYTKPGENLKKWLEEVSGGLPNDRCKVAERILHDIYEKMEYRQGVTNVHTSAEEAAQGKQGVCQDYAHIMIALCRLMNIPARYVVGMMQGEGYSHAWVEVGADGFWRGMDPTNNRLVDDTYIKISHGRDYQDCIVNRGVFQCAGTQEQSVKVLVE